MPYSCHGSTRLHAMHCPGGSCRSETSVWLLQYVAAVMLLREASRTSKIMGARLSRYAAALTGLADKHHLALVHSSATRNMEKGVENFRCVPPVSIVKNSCRQPCNTTPQSPGMIRVDCSAQVCLGAAYRACSESRCCGAAVVSESAEAANYGMRSEGWRQCKHNSR